MSLGSILPTLYSTDFYETWQQSWSSVPLESRERSLDPSFFPDLTVIRHTQNTAVDVNFYRLGTLETGLYSTLFSHIIFGLWFLANLCEVVYDCICFKCVLKGRSPLPWLRKIYLTFLSMVHFENWHCASGNVWIDHRISNRLLAWVK